jgi:hypothetical protein
MLLVRLRDLGDSFAFSGYLSELTAGCYFSVSGFGVWNPTVVTPLARPVHGLSVPMNYAELYDGLIERCGSACGSSCAPVGAAHFQHTRAGEDLSRCAEPVE